MAGLTNAEKREIAEAWQREARRMPHLGTYPASSSSTHPAPTQSSGPSASDIARLAAALRDLCGYPVDVLEFLSNPGGFIRAAVAARVRAMFPNLF
ncbi:MAG: hypothetical protein Q7W51_05745 [Coriobacteriia bacterium]|nr:hypothetical protein [Coriobacteriia bacterium]